MQKDGEGENAEDFRIRKSWFHWVNLYGIYAIISLHQLLIQGSSRKLRDSLCLPAGRQVLKKTSISDTLLKPFLRVLCGYPYAVLIK